MDEWKIYYLERCFRTADGFQCSNVAAVEARIYRFMQLGNLCAVAFLTNVELQLFHVLMAEMGVMSTSKVSDASM